MKWHFLTFFCLVSISSTLKAQPDWFSADARMRNYPKDKFLIGISSMSYKTNDPRNLNDVRSFAIANLAQSIFLQVVEADPTVKADFFDKNSITISSLEQAGMSTEFYVDSIDLRVYAFSFLSKRGFVKQAYSEMGNFMDKVKSILLKLDTASINDSEDLLSKCSSNLLSARLRQDVLRKLDVDNSTVLMKDRFSLYQEIINERLALMQESQDTDLITRVRLVATQMANEISSNIISVGVFPITYQNTNTTTEFSGFIHELLTNGVRKNFQVSFDSFIKWRLNGTYWINEDQLMIALSFQEFDGNEIVKTLTTESIHVNIDDVKSMGYTYLLPIKNQAIINSAFLLDEPNGGLNSTLTTNKGTKSLLFKEGETLELSISVTHPSFVRLVNVTTDGAQLSILDNYYVERTNDLISLPFQWETKCPCGSEYLKLFVQSHPFDALITELDENDFEVVKGDLNEMTRSLRTTQQARQTNDPSFIFGEASLILTTIPKN